MADTFDFTTDRRRAPRVDLLANLQGHVVTLDERVQVRQLSPLGMSVETTAPLSPRLEHDFRITFEAASLTVHGRVVHGRVVVRGDTVSYVAGIEFANASPEALAGIERILEVADQAPERG